MTFFLALAFWAQNRDIHPLEGQNRSGHGTARQLEGGGWKAGSRRLAAFMSNVLCIATWVQIPVGSYHTSNEHLHDDNIAHSLFTRS